jgi:hypothetical protein
MVPSKAMAPTLRNTALDHLNTLCIHDVLQIMDSIQHNDSTTNHIVSRVFL